MMTTGQVLALAALSFAGYAGVAQATVADIGWKDIASGGAATMVILVVVIFLRTQGEMRKEHSETVGRISADFSESVRSITQQFAEGTQKIIEGSRQHNQANLAMLQQIINDLHDKR